jgi:signal transduction histidine kinase
MRLICVTNTRIGNFFETAEDDYEHDSENTEHRTSNAEHRMKDGEGNIQCSQCSRLAPAVRTQASVPHIRKLDTKTMAFNFHQAGYTQTLSFNMSTPVAPSSGLSETPNMRPVWKRYGFALAALLLAFMARMAFDPEFGSKHVFLTFTVATILVTWYGGSGPALITATLGCALACYFFLEPRDSFHVANFADVVLPPILVQLCIITFGQAMHSARQRADTNAREAIDHQKQLEQEVVERKRAEEEVRRLNTELERRVAQRTAELVAINQELESFTYSVSHDLRAPLRHVDGYAQILEEEFGPQLPAEAQKFTKKIRLGSQNMGRLVDDLLNLSHVGKTELTRRHVALDPLVEEVLTEVKLEAGARSIEWHVGQLPSVECDPGLIKQVFANLLSNAVKYTRRREQARIEVGESRNSGETVIFVRDNGVGFNMKYSSKLFGVFQRLHRSEDFEGTGVGLATVARIIRKHGGRIWAEAVPNQGATFFFSLGPAALIDAANGAPSPGATQPKAVAA